MRRDFKRGWRLAPVTSTVILVGFVVGAVLSVLQGQWLSVVTGVIFVLMWVFTITDKGTIDRLRYERDDALYRLYQELR